MISSYSNDCGQGCKGFKSLMCQNVRDIMPGYIRVLVAQSAVGYSVQYGTYMMCQLFDSKMAVSFQKPGGWQRQARKMLLGGYTTASSCRISTVWDWEYFWHMRAAQR